MNNPNPIAAVDLIPQDQLTRKYIAHIKEIDAKIKGTSTYEQQIELILEKIKNKRRPMFKDDEYSLIGDILTKELTKWGLY